ncbi:MAG: PQQ-binding-like beta-propeller repeat protein [Verrucomicrobiota bacterium]
MKPSHLPFVRSLLFLLAAIASDPGALGSAADSPGNWPQLRGPDGNGQAGSAGLPLEWSETNNISWKTPIHDSGWSSPVIWNTQVWLTTARADGLEMFAVCIDRDQGQVLHDVKVFDSEKVDSINPGNTYASPTSVIETGRLYVHFGTYGTACLDTETGKVLWSRRDLNCDHEVGPGSSLASVGNLLVFHVDGRDQQYVIALDKTNGKTVWKTPRSIDFAEIGPNFRKAFSTAALVEAAGHLQLVCPGAQGVMAYDARTGEELWKVRYKGWSVVLRPVCGQGMAFLGTDFDHPQLWAVRLDGHGDVTDTHVAWKISERMPATPSPLLVDDLLYVVNDGGIASCLEAQTGRSIWEQRLDGGFNASPLYGAGRIYFFGRDGTTSVLAPGREPRMLAVNKLEGVVMACPAVTDNSLFVRTKTHLYRIGDSRP